MGWILSEIFPLKTFLRDAASAYCWWKKSCTIWDVLKPCNFYGIKLPTSTGERRISYQINCFMSFSGEFIRLQRQCVGQDRIFEGCWRLYGWFVKINAASKIGGIKSRLGIQKGEDTEKKSLYFNILHLYPGSEGASPSTWFSLLNATWKSLRWMIVFSHILFGHNSTCKI